MSPRTLMTRAPALLLVLLLVGGVGGCGEADSRADPGADPDGDPAPAASVVEAELALTFHRGEEPVQVTRTVSVPLEAGEVEPAPELVLEQALTALVHGPTPAEEEMGFTSFFSSATGGILRRVTLDEGRAVVDFHDFRALIPGASSSAGSLAFLSELNGTLFAAVPVAEVEYRLLGSCDEFWAFLQRACTVVPRPASAD